MEMTRNQRQMPIRASGKQNLTRILLPVCLIVVWFQSHSTMPKIADDVTDTKTAAQQKKSPITCPQLDFAPRKKEEEDGFQGAWTSAVKFVKENRLTFLPQDALKYHRSKLYDIESKGVPGTIVECGVAKAGSSISIAAYKNPRRCLHLFDTFEGIPQPSAKDGSDVLARYRDIQKGKAACKRGSSRCDKSYYGNMENLLAYDISQFESAGLPPKENAVYFHQGLFDDTVWPEGPIAYAHLDGDWYDSTYNMLERLSPYISTGGYFVLDDVYEWSGAKNAFQDFFQVDLKWLEKHRTKMCQAASVTREENGDSRTKYYRVAIEVRAMAQALGSKTASLVDCKQPLEK